MDAQHKKRIQVNFVFIKDNMSDVESVVDQLIQREIFSLEQRSDIVKENASSRDTCQKLIDSLIKSGPAAYDHFLTALQETNNTHLVERLNMTTIEKPPSKKASVTSMEEIPKQNEEQDVVQQTKDCQEPPTMTNEILNPTENRQKEFFDTMKRIEENIIQIREEIVKRDDKIAEAIAKLQDEAKLYREKSLEFVAVSSKLLEKEEQYSTLQNAYIKLKKQLEEGRTRLEARNKQNLQQTKRIEELESELRTLKHEMINIEQEKNKVLKDLKSLEETVTRQKTELEQLKLEMEKELQKKENRINSLKNDKQDLKQKCTSLSDQANQQCKTIDQLFTVIDEIKIQSKSANRISQLIPPFCANGDRKASKNKNFKNQNKNLH